MFLKKRRIDSETSPFSIPKFPANHENRESHPDGIGSSRQANRPIIPDNQSAPAKNWSGTERERAGKPAGRLHEINNMKLTTNNQWRARTATRATGHTTMTSVDKTSTCGEPRHQLRLAGWHDNPIGTPHLRIFGRLVAVMLGLIVSVILFGRVASAEALYLTDFRRSKTAANCLGSQPEPGMLVQRMRRGGGSPQLFAFGRARAAHACAMMPLLVFHNKDVN